MPLPWHLPLLGSNVCGVWPGSQPVADGVAQPGIVDAEVAGGAFALVLTGISAGDVDGESPLLSPLAITTPLTKANTTSTATVATIHQVLREPVGSNDASRA